MKPLFTLLLLSTITVLQTSGQAKFTDKFPEEEIKGKVARITTVTYKAPGAVGNPQDSNVKFEIGRKVVSSYDKKGNKIETYRYQEDGSLSNKIVFTYDNNDRLIKGDNYNPDGSIGSAYSIKYDNKGNEVENTTSGSFGMKNSFVYDSKGTLLEGNSTMGSSEIRTVYNYKNAGKEIESTTYRLGKPDGKFINKFNSKNQLIEEEQYIQQFSGGSKLSWKRTHKYDNNGKLIEQTMLRYRGDEVLETKQVYSYDKSGNWTKKMISENNAVMAVTERTIQYASPGTK